MASTIGQSTKGKVIKCQAAIAWGPNQPLTVEEIEVQPPQRGEVRVKTMAFAICHTDLHGLDERSPGIKYPAILGHESAGIVESVGPGVTSLVPGDHVLPVFMPFCDKCKFCKNPNTNWCDKKWVPWFQNMEDGTSRFTCRGQKVWHFMATSAFTEYSVVGEIFTAKITPTVPLDEVCLLACGVGTGFGAAQNAAKVEKGSTCAIWGLGTIGLSVAMGCRMNGAKMIIGVDLNPEKEQIARKLGVTHFLNPKTLDKPLLDTIREMTDGGCDYTFECIGNISAMRTAFDACHIAWGKCYILGVAPGQRLDIVPTDLMKGKSLMGSTYGDFIAKRDAPKLIQAYQDGKLNLKEFITARKSMKDINEAVQMLYRGEGLRTVFKLF